MVVSAQHFAEVTNGYEQTTSGLWTHKGNLDAATLRASYGLAPRSGAGVEVQYDRPSTTGYILAYDRDASAYRPLSIMGSNISISAQGGTLTLSGAAPWLSLTLSGTFTHYPGTWGPGQYRKMPDGMVRLRGLLNGGALGQTITTLPAGYRPDPARNYLFACAMQTGVCRIDVNGDGTLMLSAEIKGGTYTAAGWISLHEISFLGEA